MRAWEVWEAPRGIAAYVGASVAALVGLWIWSLPMEQPSGEQLAVLTVCGGGMLLFLGALYRTGRAQTNPAMIADSEAVWFLALGLLLPLNLAIPTIVFLYLALDASMGDYMLHRAKLLRRRMPAYKRAFNAAMMGLMSAGAHLGYTTIANLGEGLIWESLALFAGVATYLVINVVVLCGVVSIAARRSFFKVVRESIGDYSPQVATLSCGALFVIAWWFHPLTVAFVIPLVAALQRSALHSGLLQESRTDTKTGLVNSGYWHQLAEAQFSRARNSGESFAVAVVDLDHFKQINDTHGHLVGDEVLIEIAKRLSSGVRAGDTVGRFGGEEFVVLLPGVGEEAARSLGERCRVSVAEPSVSTAAGELEIRASVGVAVYAGESSLHLLLERADTALYGAKEGGRNLVCLAAAPEQRSAA